MYQITKRFQGYPFAHRQHTHDGHCKLIHGHNWDFEICLTSDHLDENNFVYDFGKFKWLKEWFSERFDHTCVISQDDPELDRFQTLHSEGFLNLFIVPSCSAEGLAKLVYEQVRTRLDNDADLIERDVKLAWVRVYEDHKNVAQYGGEYE